MIFDAYHNFDREYRQNKLEEAKNLVKEKIDALPEDDAIKTMMEETGIDFVAEEFKAAEKKIMRAMILDENVRADGRKPNEVRPIWCEVGVIPRAHGSAVFTRGQTQNLLISDIGENNLYSLTGTFDEASENKVYEESLDAYYTQKPTNIFTRKDTNIYEFNNDKNKLESLAANNTENKFTDISKYIRFVDGAIIIGIEGNPLILRMQNDRISFLENGNEVAYISNRRLYITDAEVITSLTIGNFAFLPRNNGNLSFRKIRG